MGKPILTGSFVALITPFKENGSPDIEDFGQLAAMGPGATVAYASALKGGEACVKNVLN